MIREASRRQAPLRAGAATVEFAILLPVIAFLFLITVDYARLFYHAIIVTNCARNGALYGSDSVTASQSAYKTIEEAALADSSNLSPAPTVASTYGSDADGNYVEVTVTYDFQTLTSYPVIPSNVRLARTVRMRVSPVVPGFN
jgi:Flp pilus assembly protein TadG